MVTTVMEALTQNAADHPFYIAQSIWGCNHGSVAPPDRGTGMEVLSHFLSPKISLLKSKFSSFYHYR
jgi:hypothetical protein